MSENNPLQISLEPNWASWQRMRHTSVPHGIQQWLRDSGSLTARLKAACPGGFRVRLMHQGWGKPLYSERRLLGIQSGEIAIIREVELHCNHTPWVFARTLIPASSLKGPARRLTMLGERPLGEVLFADPRMRRGTMEMARMTPRHPLFNRALAHVTGRVDCIWGRRTLFRLAGQPLLVNEIFLPGLPERPR